MVELNSVGRKHALESNFQANKALGWSLRRVDALAANAVAHQPPSCLRDPEKACFLSHIKAIETAKLSAGHVMIAEDDIQFGARSLAAIDAALARAPADSWDIIFTDIWVTSTHAMLDLLLLRRRVCGDAAPRLINLGRMPFVGATAYIVNANSRDKILYLLPRGDPLEIPYDVYLQQLIHNNRLRGFVTFPFATTLSSNAETSQIEEAPSRDKTAMNAFRRLMWLERDIGAAAASIDKVRTGMDDPETLAFLKILSVFLAPDFEEK